MTVREFEQRVGSDEITEWMAFFSMQRMQQLREEMDAKARRSAQNAADILKRR